MSTNCGHDHCGRCCGGSCTGCGALELTPDEIALLRRFAQLPFLPIAQRMDGAPVCMEEGEYRARALGDAAELLSSRGLAALD